MTSPSVKRAIISVSDKLGLADFARGLHESGVEIYSTGGTRRHLESEGIAVRDISDYTGFAEMMDGRLKTLHPKIFGGILCRHDREDDMAAVRQHGIACFELVVVNLYPFAATIVRTGVTRADAIEQIDIGGPSLVRAAAKNHDFVTIVTSHEQYPGVLQEIKQHGCTRLETRQRLMADAFSHTAAYDRVIADYFSAEVTPEDFPPTERLTLRLKAKLRYGENPHQQAAVYADSGALGANLVSARQLNGKELSYNNLLDLDSALVIARSLPDAAACVIKHNNPCGAASALTLADAAKKALDGDPVSAFGSVLGFNQTVDVSTAECLAEPGLFVEAIVAPGYEPAAVELLTTKPKWKNNVRLMQVGQLNETRRNRHLRQIDGGVLMQDSDIAEDSRADWQIVTQRQPDSQLLAELQFGWAIVRHVKSNAITLSKDRALCGVAQAK